MLTRPVWRFGATHDEASLSPPPHISDDAPGALVGRSPTPGARIRPQPQKRPRMPRDQLEASHFSPDILEFILLLHAHDVRYVGVPEEFNG